MNINDVNTILKEFGRKYLSPDSKERENVSKQYIRLQQMLPGTEIFQSGSYKRETAVTPIHDLDVIWVLPDAWQEKIIKSYTQRIAGSLFEFDVSEPLKNLGDLLRLGYSKLGESVKIDDSQTHSVKISFPGKETFTIDVVPAVKSGKKNGYQGDMYLVPEIQKTSHGKWVEVYKSRDGKLRWVLSDPDTYIKQAEELNANTSYRKTVKFIKVWKKSCNAGLTGLELKSFHLELIVSEIFRKNKSISFYDASVRFLSNLQYWLSEPRLPDEADNSVFVDSYLNEDDPDGSQRSKVYVFAHRTLQYFQSMLAESDKDHAYLKLRSSLVAMPPWIVVQGNYIGISINCTAKRKKKWVNSSDWRKGVPHMPQVWVDNYNNPRPLQSDQQIEKGYDLKFIPEVGDLTYDEIKWLIVNNGTDALETHRIRGWRGNEFQLSDEDLFYKTEFTQYSGRHWIDCFVLNDGVCIGYGRFFVRII